MARSRFPVLLLLAVLSCGRDLNLPGGGPPPEIGLVSPCLGGVSAPCHDNAVVSGDVTVRVARVAGGELSAVELWTSGIEAVRLSAPPWTWTIHTKDLYPVGGVMPVYVTPIDAQGVRASPSQFSFIVDNAGPDVTIAAPVHDTSWPMTLPVSVSVCASDVQGVASVTATAGASQGVLTQSGTCTDGRPRFTGTVAAPSGGQNTLPFDLLVRAQDARGNTSSTFVPLVATRQRWLRATHSPAAFYGGPVLPVLQSVQHPFRAYAGGVVVQTSSGNNGYIYWMPADGSAPTWLAPSLNRYSFAPFGDGRVAVVGQGPAAGTVQLWDAVGGTTVLGATNSAVDWGGLGSLVAHGDNVACFATDDSNVNVLFQRIGCFNRSGTTRFSRALNVLTNDMSALTVAGDVVVALRLPASGCAGVLFDRYTPGGALLAGSPCLATRAVRPYVHGDAYGAAVLATDGSAVFFAAHVDTAGTVTNVSSLGASRGTLLARGKAGRLLWSKGDSVLLQTVVSVTDAAGNLLGSTTLPFTASLPYGYAPTGNFDGFYSDAAGFDADDNAYLVLMETLLTGSVFHVVSLDANGALRWHYTTTPLMALSLAPAQTSEPLYLLHDDGAVEALVR